MHLLVAVVFSFLLLRFDVSFAGVNVIGCGRNEFRLKAYAKTCPGPGQFIPIRCDIAQEMEIAHMVQVIKQNYGTVDILVNNAGKCSVHLLVFLFKIIPT